MVDRHRVDADHDPDPTLFFEAESDPDPDSTLSFTLLYMLENLKFLFYLQQCQFSRQRHRCHKFSSLDCIHLY
jgi:hypothetical protein